MQDDISSLNPWEAIKNQLTTLNKQDLLQVISDLYRLSHINQSFLKTKYISQNPLEHYQSVIKNHLTPKDRETLEGMQLKEAKNAISHYKKTTKDMLGTLELMICYLEYGTEALCKVEEAPMQYYYSLAFVFNSVLKDLKKYDEAYVKKFIQRLFLIVEKAKHLEWQYYETISDLFQKAYPNYSQ